MKATAVKINKSSQFYKDMTNTNDVIEINGMPVLRAMYNLLLSKRDCNLYAKGIKPSRYWKITDVKKYYGLTGSASKLATDLQNIYDWLLEK